MANLETIELTISGSSEQAQQGINQLITSLGSLSEAITNPYNKLRVFNDELQRTARLTRQIKMPDLSTKTGASGAVSATKRNAPERYHPETKAVSQQEAMDLVASKQSDLVYMKAQGMLSEYIEKAQGGQLSFKQLADGALQIKKTTDQFEKMVDAERKAKEEVQTFPSAFSKLKEGFSGLTKGLTGFFSKVKRIATTMLIRSAIRGLIKSIKEGVNNLYEWSKLNNGAFAKSLDTIKNKAGELKNSLGAAIAPVIQAAIPVIQSLMNAAIGAFNWVNQLISLLTGKSSWTKATEGVHDYTDATKKATGANKEWLASFDELNVMTSGGGGGGSGKKQVDYSDMFEEVYEFDSKIKEISQFLKDNAQSIHDLAIATGLAIIEWKLAGAFAEALPLLATICGYLATAGAIAITLQIDWMLTNEYLKTGKEGWLFASVLTSAVGATAAWAIATKLIGTGAGYYAASITLALTALTDIIAVLGNTDVGAFSKESITTLITAALKGGAAVGIMLKVFGGAAATPTLVAAGAGSAALAIFGVAIGLKTALDPNVKLFSKDHLIGTITSALLVGFGTYIFFGSLPAAGIAALVTVGVVIGLKLMTKGNEMRWGNLELTEDQVEKFVTQRMFKTPINLFINKFNTMFEERDKLESTIRQKVTDLDLNLNVLKLGIDTKTTLENIEAIIGDSESGLIADLTSLFDLNISQMKLTFANIDIYDSEGNTMTTDTLLSGIRGWENVKKQMELDGKELSELLIKGAKGELTPQMEEYTQVLLEKVMNMSTKIAKATEFGEASAEFSTAALDALTKKSFSGVIDAYNKYSSQYEETIRKTIKQQIATWYELADLTDDPKLKAEYKRIADEMSAGFETTVAAELDSETAPGREMILEWITGMYDFGSIDGHLGNTISDKLRGAGLTSDKFKSVFREYIHKELGTEPIEFNAWDLVGFSGWDLLTENLKQQFLKYVTITPNTMKELQKAGVPAEDLVKFVNWDKVKNMGQNEFAKAMVEAYGGDGIASIKSRFPNIQASEICKVSKQSWKTFTIEQKFEFVNALRAAFGTNEAISAARNAGIDIGALIKSGMNSQNPEIKKQAEEWNKLIKKGVENPSPQPKVQIQEDKSKTTSTIASITGALGVFKPNVNVQENRQNTNSVVGVINGALGVFKPSVNVQENRSNTNNVRSIINSALGSFNPNVNVQENRSQTNSTKNLIIGALGVFAPLVNAQENRNETNKAKSGISSTIGSFYPSVKATENKDSTNAAKSSINGSLGTVKSTVNVAVNTKTTDEARKGIVGALGAPFSVAVNASLNNSSAFRGAVKSSLNGIKITMKPQGGGTVSTIGTIAAAASGGLFNSADLFFANENGNAEMIGRFGNQTGVANQREIVAGIQKGVADANAEQNALLRQQNNLLRALLEKENTVHIGASSEMGRVVSRSLGMYNAMVGG